VLANLQAGVVILDAQYRVCELNRRAREWLELGAAAAETLTVRQLPSGVAAVILEAGQNGAATQSREVLLPRRQRTLRVSVTQVTAAGRLVWVVLLDDVTAAKEQLAAARQLEEREFFARVAYRLSHELKNSLVSIKIFGQLLPERYNEKDFREQFSSVVVNEVNRVDVLVNNLTFFAQPLGLVYEELSLNDLLAACVENVTQEFARKKIAQVQVVGDRNAEPTGLPLVTVKQTFGHKFARLAGDKIRLMQAFEHILRNAVQAMPQGGRLTIHTADATEADFPGGTLPAGGAVRIEFVDSGEGISLENLRRVTEPFVTTRNVGVGLGLTIVKKIVERHSGRLELDSLLGRGTTVRVWLPVVQQPHSEDKWLAELAKSRSASEFFSGETADDDQNRLAQMMDAHRRRRAAES
jgi:signal transduction histidine kinase